MRAAVWALSVFLSCAHSAVPAPGRVLESEVSRGHDAKSFLTASLRSWPREDSTGLIALSDPRGSRVATYDSALVALVLIRAGDRERASRVLEALLGLQEKDGGLPFSFTLPAPDPASRYERSGAIAWVGYAAAEYLDSDRGGPRREIAFSLAHRAAAYLLAHQVNRAGDPRDGLVRGGAGTYRYEIDGATVREALEPGDVTWASVEHNVDAYFFLRALARVADSRVYAEGARRIAGALTAHGWSADRGQLVAGLDAGGPDLTPALDCASWASVFLGAVGATGRAETAFFVADGRYASADPASGVPGHRPYASGPLYSDEALMRHFAGALRVDRWEHLDAVWPEGSAGVAFAALRAGHPERARAILDAIEPLRAADGSLPESTAAVPFVLDTLPSVAGTAWAALVRFELDRPTDRPTLWTP